MAVIDPGYSIWNGIFSDAECCHILDGLSGIGRSRAGARNLMAMGKIAQLARDQRLLTIAGEMLGEAAVPFKATLFEKTGKANWLVAYHQDTALPLEVEVKGPGWGPASNKNGVVFVHAPTWALEQIVALRIHLDASTASNGPLRIIPGTHKKRVRDDAELQSLMTREAEVECLADRGGVIAMSPLILHASSKAQTDKPRRVLHVEYARTFDLALGVRLAIS